MILHCSRCRKGPFKKEDLDNKIFEYGDERNPIRYCTDCVSLLNLKEPESIALIYNKHNKSKPEVNKIDQFIDINKPIEDIVTILPEVVEKTKIVKGPRPDEVFKVPDNELKSTYSIPKIKKGNYGVYIVRCKDNTLFCGISQNIEKSLKYINKGSGNKYTRSKERRPVTLVYFKIANDIKEANIKKIKLQNRFSTK